MFSFLKKLFARGQKRQEMSDTVYVGNLPYSVGSSDLRTEFAQFGKIVKARIIRNHRSKRSKGFGFVTFEEEANAVAALAMDSQEIQGRSIRVSLAMERDAAA